MIWEKKAPIPITKAIFQIFASLESKVRIPNAIGSEGIGKNGVIAVRNTARIPIWLNHSGRTIEIWFVMLGFNYPFLKLIGLANIQFCIYALKLITIRTSPINAIIASVVLCLSLGIVQQLSPLQSPSPPNVAPPTSGVPATKSIVNPIKNIKTPKCNLPFVF